MPDKKREAQSLRLSDAQKLFLAQLFNEASEFKVNSVTVGFSGSGDEGQSETPSLWLDEGKNVEIKNETLSDSFEKMADEILEASDVDWYNNDGGHGEVFFKVEARTVHLDINVNETVSHAVPFKDLKV